MTEGKRNGDSLVVRMFRHAKVLNAIIASINPAEKNARGYRNLDLLAQPRTVEVQLEVESWR